jgi:hypothetical protein
MPSILYYALTAATSVLGIVGIRPYDQPRYVVLRDLAPQAEIRRYDAALAIEATVPATDRDQAASQAFGLLFAYITGANQRAQSIAMTAPVSTEGEAIAMTAPVATATADGKLTMRFFLPPDVAEQGAPQPTDPRLHLQRIPEKTIATIRYSGTDSAQRHQQKAQELLALLQASKYQPQGEPYRLNYDPPFALPFVRRNEAAVAVTSRQP